MTKLPRSRGRLRAPALVAGFAALGLPGLAHATVVWTAGFEVNKSGDVCASTMPGAEFTPGAIVVEGTRIDAEVLGEQVYAGNLACKVTVHPDDIFGQYKQDRVDVKHISTLTGEGKDMYLSGYYYLPADAQTRDEFGMFETMKSLNWIDIWVEPKTGGGTTIKLGIESNGANLGSVPVWSGDLSVGTWHQIAIHVLWSQDPTKGTLDFWLDGKQVVTAFKHKTRPDGTDLYYLTGLHRVLMQPYTESIYFDDFIEADAQSDIKIGPPGAGSVATDGGADATATTGAGGAVGAGGANGAAGSNGSAGTGGTTGAGGSASGAAGTTGAAGSPSGSAGATSGAAGNGATTGAAGGGTTTGAAGASTTGSGGSHGHSSSGCAITPTSPTTGPGGLLALACAAFGMRRRKR
jgi:hypothetical protein